MQIWKKNFLLIYVLFLFVIYGGLLILDCYISQNEWKQWMDHARSSDKSLFYLAAGLKDEEISRISMNMKEAAEKYQESGIQVRIRINSYVAADYFPKELESGQAVKIRKKDGESFLVIGEEKSAGEDIIEVNYAENLAELSQFQKRRMWIFCALGAALSAGIGIFLYCMMRRINRPVNQIAHELRTPLTGIRGYAEYLMLGKLTQEDCFFAARQIVDSAKNLEDITEKLLIMGNVREGALQIGRLDVRRLLSELKNQYPDVETDCKLDYLNGDVTLVRCLLENLISNAVSAGSEVKVTVDEKRIRVWNDGEPMNEKLLKTINKGQELAGIRGGKHGYGIGVCREIALVHGWKLRYESAKEEGTAAICEFGQMQSGSLNCRSFMI